MKLFQSSRKAKHFQLSHLNILESLPLLVTREHGNAIKGPLKNGVSAMMEHRC